MGDLTIGLLSALLATNQPAAVSNLVSEQTGLALPVETTTDPTERELRTVMINDDAAMDEVNAWISTNQIPRTDTNGVAQFNQKIRNRLDVVRQDYDTFLRDHPDSAHGYLAYGSFLTDIGEEQAAETQYLNSKAIDPKNPAVWNQLANYYGENGELTNAFADYTQAIRLDPSEPVYYENLATTVYLYRKDARGFYHFDEQQVFDKALELYQQAMKLDPDNLVLATDFANSYYGIKPLRTNDALVAWTNALSRCQNETEREGVQIHLARVKIAAGYYDEAQGHLDTVTNGDLSDLRKRLEHSLADHKNPPTNPVPEMVTNTEAAPATLASTQPAVTPVNPAVFATNQMPASTNALDVSSNLLAAPPEHLEQK